MRRKRGKGGAPKLSAIVLVFLGVMAVILLWRTAQGQGAFAGKGAEKTVGIARYFSTECVSFFELEKNVCMYPDAIPKLVGELDGDVGTLIANFWVMATDSEGRENIPQTSWIEVDDISVSGAEVPQVLISLSDGVVVYGMGRGNTFREAMDDLVLKFFRENGNNRRFETPKVKIIL